MIVKGDKGEQDVAEATPVNRAADTESILSNPPPYSPANEASSSTAGAQASSTGPSIPPPNATRCNFLTILRENSGIKGAFIVDSNLQIPAELLAPLQDGESENDRPNLRLKCQNASINADVWIDSSVNGDGQEPELGANETKKKVVIDVYSHNGSSTVKLTADLLSQPVKVTVRSHNGSASLILPSTFTGPLTIGSKNGSVKISDMIQSRSTTFSDVKGLRSCFIGNFNEAGFGSGKEWHGSSVHVQSHNGGVKVSFTEEANDLACKKASSGFFSKWFAGV